MPEDDDGSIPWSWRFDALLNGLALQALTSEAALDRERIRDEVIRTLLGEVAAAGAAQAVAR